MGKWDWCVPSVNALIAPRKIAYLIIQPFFIGCHITVFVLFCFFTQCGLSCVVFGTVLQCRFEILLTCSLFTLLHFIFNNISALEIHHECMHVGFFQLVHNFGHVVLIIPFLSYVFHNAMRYSFYVSPIISVRADGAGYAEVQFCVYIVCLWNLQEYLARLRQIRLQNFNERQQIKARLRGEKV